MTLHKLRQHNTIYDGPVIPGAHARTGAATRARHTVPQHYTQHMHDATHIHGSRTLPHSMLPYTGTRMITCSGSLPSSMMAQPNPWTP